MKLLLFTCSLSLILIQYLPPREFEYQVVMVISLLRHGARTPSKLRPELNEYFPNMQLGKLTFNGFRQMVLMGKVHRKMYLENENDSPYLKDFIDINKVNEQFLVICSPKPRAIDSAVGYMAGIFPEYFYKTHDLNSLGDENEDFLPPIYSTNQFKLNHSWSSDIMNKTFNLIIESRERDVVFHSRKCTFPSHILDYAKPGKPFEYLSKEDKVEVFNFYKNHFNITLKEVDLENFSDRLARSLYTTVRSINFNFKEEKLKIPKNVHSILQRLLAYYLFIKRTESDEVTKITSSPFLDHIIQFFDYKISKSQTKVDFYELGRFNYTDLRFVTYSGHDYNFVGLNKNLLDLNTIVGYIENIEDFHKILIIPFGSNIDIHLIRDTMGNYYVKIFLNGEELFDRLRSYKAGKQLVYDKEKGIPYKIFRKVLQSRIFENYHYCLSTK